MSYSPALVEILRLSNLTLPRNAAEWRVVYNHAGEPIGMPGVHVTHGHVRELLTDGVVSWFVVGPSAFLGHKANFEPEARPLAEAKPRFHGMAKGLAKGRSSPSLHSFDNLD